jgi:hypothetical protein
MFVEGSGGLLGDEGRVNTVLRQDSAGELEVLEGLLTGPPRASGRDDLRLGWDVSGELSLGIQPGAALSGCDALQAARMSELTSIRYVPSLTVRRGVDARCRYTDEQG